MDCWHHEIDTATTEAEVVRNAGEYLLLWAPRHLSAESLGLPKMRIESGEDIERVNERLAQTGMRGDRSSAARAHLRELAQYFRHAAMRLGELRRIPSPAPARYSASV
jgi:hypothetical protein